MKVSIAMATYNGSSYIQEQLQSFLKQTRQPDELIICDDCSTDDTVEIIKEFSKQTSFPVILTVNKQNLGYTGNFNEALKKTTGDLVFLSDQDDVWFPEKIQYICNLAEKNQDMLLMMNDAILTDSSLTEVGLTIIEQTKSAGMSIDTFGVGCCCAIHRDLLEICLPIPSAFKGHDNWILAFANALKAKKIDRKVLQYYRRHESNESQFITNRIEKVTRVRAFLLSSKSFFDVESRSRYVNSIEQMRILAERVRSISASEKHRDSLSLFLINLEATIKTDNQRLELRDKIFFVRLPTALSYYYKGYYSNTKGLLSGFRDMLGYPVFNFASHKTKVDKDIF